jgi:hypothetical protein
MRASATFTIPAEAKRAKVGPIRDGRGSYARIMGLRSTLSGSTAATIAVSALIALPAAASTPPSWSQSVTIGQTGRESGAPEIAIAPDGEAIAAWEGGRPNGIQVSTREPGGNWTPPVTLAKSREAEGPHVAASARKAVVVWSDTTHTRSGEASVVMAATRLKGKAWSRPKNISAEARWREEPRGEEPQVTIARGGQVTAIWSANDEGHSTTPFIRSATQSARGTEWSAPVGLPGSIEGESPEVAATPAGEVVGIWSASYDEESGLEVSSRPPSGKWRLAKRLDNPGAFAKPLLAITSKGDAVGVWVKEFGEGSQVLQVATRKPSGRWEVKTLAPKSYSYSPSIVTEPGGRAKVVWVLGEPLGEGGDVVSSTLSPGGNWSAPTSLAAEGLRLPGAADPEIAVTESDEAIAAWTTGGLLGEETTIQGASKPRGQPWSEPTDISNSPAPPQPGASELRIAVAPSGEAFAVWHTFNGTEWVIDVATRPPAALGNS